MTQPSLLPQEWLKLPLRRCAALDEGGAAAEPGEVAGATGGALADAEEGGDDDEDSNDLRNALRLFVGRFSKCQDFSQQLRNSEKSKQNWIAQKFQKSLDS